MASLTSKVLSGSQTRKLWEGPLNPHGHDSGVPFPKFLQAEPTAPPNRAGEAISTPLGSGNPEGSTWRGDCLMGEVSGWSSPDPQPGQSSLATRRVRCRSVFVAQAGPESDGRWCSSQLWASLHMPARIHQAESRGPSQSPGRLGAPRSGPLNRATGLLGSLVLSTSVQSTQANLSSNPARSW